MGYAANAIRYRRAYEPEDGRVSHRLLMARAIIVAALGEKDGLDVASDESIEKAYALADELIRERASLFHLGPRREAEVKARGAAREKAEASEALVSLKRNFADHHSRGWMVLDEKARMEAAESRYAAAVDADLAAAASVREHGSVAHA